MAQFYQDPNPTSDPDYVRASREPDRVQADTSMGTLFEGIGNATNLAGKALKEGFENRIKQDTRDLVQPIMDEHGASTDLDTVKAIAGTGAKGRVRALQMQNGGPTYDDAGGATSFAPEDARLVMAQGIFDDATKKELPPSASKELDGVSRMNAAYSAGNLSDSYFNGQLVQVVSKLKARYPGFEDEIDSSVSNITGVKPANALRSSLQRDIQYNQAAALAGTNSYQKYVEKNEGIINALGLDPNKHSEETIRSGVAEWKGGQAILEAKKLRAEVGSPEAEAALSDSIAATVRTEITRQGNAAQGAMTVQQFDAEAKRMTIAGGATPKQRDDLVNQMTLARNALATKIQAEIYKPIEGRKDGHNMVSLVKEGDTKVAAIITAQLKPIDDRIALAKSGNFSALQAVTDANKYQEQVDVQNLNRNFPQARVAAAISSVFPNNPIMANRFLEQSTVLTDWQRAIKTGIGNALINGTTLTPAPKPLQAVQAYGPNADKNGTFYKETNKQYDLLISPENKHPENAAHLAKQFFSDTDYYDKLNDDGRVKLFMTMGAPGKTAFIQKLAESDPEIKTLHENWMKYAAGDIWRRSSDDLQSILTNKNYDIKFNANTMQFEDKTSYGKMSNYPGMSDQPGGTPKAISRPIQAVNNAITLLKPVVGNKPEEIFHALGVDPNAPKEYLYERVVRSIGEFLKGDQSEQRQDIKTGRRPVSNLSDSQILSMDTTEIPEGMSAREWIDKLKKQGTPGK